MIILLSHWIFEFIGRFHLLALHFPIGLFIGAFILELISKYKKQDSQLSGMIYLATVSAIVAATMGQLLFQSGSYSGELIERHQWLGWLTACLSIVTSIVYWNRSRVSKHVPVYMLAVLCISIGFAGHFGASVTHGPNYLSAAAVSSNTPINIAKWNAQDSFSKDMHDELNLEIRAIFAHNCYQCHSTAKRKGGLALDHEEGVFAGGDNGPILIKGAANQSEIIRRLELPREHEDAMPPKGKILSPESIDLIALWINQGAPWAEQGLKVFREAPLALTKPNIPNPENGLDHPIDLFVNQYFEEKGIAWPKLINDYQFMRRAYLDVTGLLPPPEAIQAFSTNTGPNKRYTLIQELLSDNESYTLHWLSFWNDLLRNDYSGPGFITNGRKQITNWLYTSLLESKPYSEMVKELISPTPESEGFIKGIQWRGFVNASQRTELQAAQNISQSLLGLNLKCASCHNSFINNLTLDQAYGFANIFADSSLQIFRCDKPTGRYTETSFIYPELGEVLADSLVDRLRLLADVIVKPENGRLYRTLVNRFWDRLFGRGIVAPVDEMDKLPWSQDLLDWLASDFVDSGYDLKHVLATMMSSQTYQLPAVDYGSPYQVASESFVFKGPTPRRMTAEQFADAVSQTINPLYYSASYLPHDPPFPAQWIWHQDIELDRNSLPKPGERYFKKNFDLQHSTFSSADILITADHSFECYVNGQKLGQGSDWRIVHRFSLSETDLMRKNSIAIKGVNDGDIPNPAGLLFALRIVYEDETEQYIYSDKTWLSTDSKPTDDWTDLNFELSDWKDVSRRGAGNSYWGKLYDFAYERGTEDIPFVRASLVKQDPFLKSLGRPSRENVATTRESDANLLQAMMLSNNQFLYQNIEEGTNKLLADSDQDMETMVRQLYQNILGRQPSQKEQKMILAELDKGPVETGIQDLIWSIILLPEFQFI